MKKLITLVIAASILVGCSDDEESESSPAELCSIQVQLTGAVEESISVEPSQGCASSSSNGQVGLSFNVSSSPTILLSFGEVVAGENATGLDASFRYLTSDFDEWNARDCTIDLSRNELIESDDTFGDTYALEGTGTCNDVAIPSGGDAMGDISVGDFEFEASAGLE